VAFNPNAEHLVASFNAQYGVTFPMGWSPREAVQDYLAHPPGKMTYVPELIFIDRKRVIRGQFSGSDDFLKDQDKNIRMFVENLLKEPVSTKKTAHSAASRKKRS
jgi:hypothetical protein